MVIVTLKPFGFMESGSSCAGPCRSTVPPRSSEARTCSIGRKALEGFTRTTNPPPMLGPNHSAVAVDVDGPVHVARVLGNRAERHHDVYPPLLYTPVSDREPRRRITPFCRCAVAVAMKRRGEHKTIYLYAHHPDSIASSLNGI